MIDSILSSELSRYIANQEYIIESVEGSSNDNVVVHLKEELENPFIEDLVRIVRNTIIILWHIITIKNLLL